MTFIVSENMEEKLFFDAWMEYINPSYKFDFRYKADYTSTLQVNQYDQQNKKIYSINLIDAFPIAVNQLDLDWSSESYHKLTVVFAYTYWQNNSIQALGSSLLQSITSEIAAGVNDFTTQIPDNAGITYVYHDRNTLSGGEKVNKPN
jgi:hypothetical protein